jgi:hypothetical protein
VFVDPALANARRLREAVADFGFGEIAPTAEELSKPDRIFMLGRKPWRIDVLTGMASAFAQVWTTRVEADFEPSPLSVIGRQALIANKRAAGRDKDLLDVTVLERHRSPGRPPRESVLPKRRRRT